MTSEGVCAGKDILIVEDSEIETMLKRLLVQNGYIVRSAKNGAEGLAEARKQKPDLIICDILMPVMDGFRMCREIKNSAELRDTPIILLTRLTEAEDVIKGLESGADTYITKPYDADYLLSKIGSLLKDPVQFKNNPDEKTIEFDYAGRHYSIRTVRGQTLSFLLSTYENAVRKNKELIKAHEELQSANERLEGKVKERTASLTAEVSERRQAGQKLTESEERFRAVVESASDAVICLQPPGRIYLWNRKAEEMFGFSAAEVTDKNLHETIAPERYRKAAVEGLNRFFCSGAGNILGKTVELTALRKDGTEFPIELSISGVKIRGLWNSVGIIRDITERKNAEELLRKSEEKYKKLVDNALVGVYRTNLNGDFLYANEALLRIFGYGSPEELASVKVQALYANPDDRKRLIEMLKKEGRVDKFETDIVVKIGKVKQVLFCAVLEGDLISGMTIDITERKALEAELKQNLEESERINKLMVGRELKMEDLRKEVHALRSRLHEMEGKGSALRPLLPGEPFRQ